MENNSPSQSAGTQTPDEQAGVTDPNATSDSLESSDESSLEAQPADSGDSTTSSAPPPKKKLGGFIDVLKRLNIYVIFFIIILVIAAGVILFSYKQNSKSVVSSNLQSTNLTQQALNQLANSDATVGTPKQILNVESNAVFAGQVLVRNGLEVAGSLQISGNAALPSLNVSGQSSFSQVEVQKNLSVIGDLAVQGQETISQSLQVNGSGTFTGAVSAPQITTSSLQLNADLALDHHIVAGGPIPSRSNGPALGSGGSVSISGSDTGGTVSVNTGASTAAGCFVTITFSSAYEAVPHVLITPVGASAGGLAYYVTRSTTEFSICDADTPPSGANFGFDYFIVG
jgi:cytoskeletal protein CcmA (bactofilin family)